MIFFYRVNIFIFESVRQHAVRIYDLFFGFCAFLVFEHFFVHFGNAENERFFCLLNGLIEVLDV